MKKIFQGFLIGGFFFSTFGCQKEDATRNQSTAKCYNCKKQDADQSKEASEAASVIANDRLEERREKVTDMKSLIEQQSVKSQPVETQSSDNQVSADPMPQSEQSTLSINPSVTKNQNNASLSTEKKEVSLTPVLQEIKVVPLSPSNQILKKAAPVATTDLNESKPSVPDSKHPAHYESKSSSEEPNDEPSVSKKIEEDDDDAEEGSVNPLSEKEVPEDDEPLDTDVESTQT